MPFGTSPVQLLIVLVILLVVFGAKRLPEIGRSLGSSAREFKEGIAGGEEKDDPKDGSVLSGPQREENKA